MVFNVVFSLCLFHFQWSVSTARQCGTDLPALCRGVPRVALPKGGTAADSVASSALHCGGPGEQWARWLRPHHRLREACRELSWSPALPGARRHPGAPGWRPAGFPKATEGALLQPTAWGEGGPLPAGHSASGHQPSHRSFPL